MASEVPPNSFQAGSASGATTPGSISPSNAALMMNHAQGSGANLMNAQQQQLQPQQQLLQQGSFPLPTQTGLPQSPSPGGASPAGVSPPGGVMRNFPEALHDQFDAVYKRVTFGRRDLKTIRAYFESRSECEKIYAARLIKDASTCAELVDSSSTIPAWKDVKEASIQLGTLHNQLGSTCSEVSNQLERVIREIKQSKTKAQKDYQHISEDVRNKQQKHDKAREHYAESIKQAETSIQQREAGRSLPPPKLANLENVVGRQLNNSNTKHEEYKRAVVVLNEAQHAYDNAVITIMTEFEKVETERLRVMHEILDRFTNQHDILQNSLVVIAQQLHRGIAGINNAKDIQDFIALVTTNTKPRPHVEYLPIPSQLIDANGGRTKVGAPLQLNQPQGFPGMAQPFPGQPGQMMAPGGGMPGQYPPYPQQGGMLQQQQLGLGTSAKFIPPPVTDRFIPPTAGGVLTAVALYDFDSTEPDDLTFKAGEVIILKACDDSEEWWNGELRGRTGIFPKTYVQKQASQQPMAAPPNAENPPYAALPSQPQHYQQQQQQPTYGTPEGVPQPALQPSYAPPAPQQQMNSSYHPDLNAMPAPPAVGANPISAAATPIANGSGGGDAPEQPREMHARCEALFDFVGQDADELSFHKGDALIITGELNGWYLGKVEGSTQVGIFPSNYVSLQQ